MSKIFLIGMNADCITLSKRLRNFNIDLALFFDQCKILVDSSLAILKSDFIKNDGNRIISGSMYVYHKKRKCIKITHS